jgi:uracil-DNA glycosylase
MTADDLPAAFATLPTAWRDALPGWTPQAQTQVVDGVRTASGAKPIGPSDPFRALRLVAPNTVKVIIVGQDPYPTAGQADGLSFSAERVSPRPSLRRIMDILERDRPGWKRPISGRLDAWAQQGVLMLNTVLTVEEGRAGSHLQVSWQVLTKHIVQAAARKSDKPIVFAWGSHAQSFIAEALRPAGEAAPSSAATPTTEGVTVLTARHPSNDFGRDFMRDGSHFAATADRVDWWRLADVPG